MKSFSSKIGVLLAAAGSAVGLGSIWKFPYVVGENGGGAFIILYIVCALVFGLPLVMNEFLIGKLSGRSAYGAFRALTGSNRWQWLSWVFLVSVIVIMSFYFVVTGWCFYYMVEAASNTFAGMNATELKAHFNAFEGNVLLMIMYAIVAIVLTAAVLWFDVNKGIERLSKILMPILFLFLIIMPHVFFFFFDYRITVSVYARLLENHFEGHLAGDGTELLHLISRYGHTCHVWRIHAKGTGCHHHVSTNDCSRHHRVIAVGYDCLSRCVCIRVQSF